MAEILRMLDADGDTWYEFEAQEFRVFNNIGELLAACWLGDAVTEKLISVLVEQGTLSLKALADGLDVNAIRWEQIDG